VSKLWENFPFWVNYSFNKCCCVESCGSGVEACFNNGIKKQTGNCDFQLTILKFFSSQLQDITLLLREIKSELLDLNLQLQEKSLNFKL